MEIVILCQKKRRAVGISLAGCVCQQSRTVTNLSKNWLQSFRQPKQASKGCRKIQIPAQKPATGHAMKTSIMSQMRAKQGFPPMVTVVDCLLWRFFFCGLVGLSLPTRRSETVNGCFQRCPSGRLWAHHVSIVAVDSFGDDSLENRFIIGWRRWERSKIRSGRFFSPWQSLAIWFFK